VTKDPLLPTTRKLAAGPGRGPTRVGQVDPHDEPALRRWYAALAEGATAGRTRR
jgi:hypothetical protein